MVINFQQTRTTVTRKKFSVRKPSRFWNANFPPYISPSKNKPLKRAFEKYKPQLGLFSEFYGNLD